MSSPAKAAAAVQNNVLLVQYSPTGNGVGDLYAIALFDMKQPLPFQIQRQAPDLQASKSPILLMSLATVPPSSGSNPIAPGTSPPAPPGSSPGSVDGSGSSPVAAAVTAAPPFLDAVLSVNDLDKTQAWHIKAPGRGIPPGATHSNLLAPLWSASILSPFFFPNATRISFGTNTPQESKKPGILALMETTQGYILMNKLEYLPGSGSVGSPTSLNTVPWKQSWDAPQLVEAWKFHIGGDMNYHATTFPTSARNNRGFSIGVVGFCGAWCMMLFNDPPTSVYHDDFKTVNHETSFAHRLACFTSTSDEMVAIDHGNVYLNRLDGPGLFGGAVNPANKVPNINGTVIACTTYKKVVIVVVPGSDGKQSRPEIHLFDLQAATWAKAQLVPAPPGTFSDTPPIPPPSGNSSGPGKGDPGEGGGSNHSDGPSTEVPSSANATTSSAGLIGGIVGGIVVLGALIFAGFFFRRRRGSKQKGQDPGRSVLKPVDCDGDHHNEQRMYDSRRRGRGDGRNPGEMDHHGRAWPSAHNQHVMSLSQAGSPQAMAWPQAYSLQEMHLSHAGDLQDTTQSWVNYPQEMAWAPSKIDHKTATSPAYSPQKRSRINNPQESTRAMVPVARRVNNPEYSPSQQL